MFLDRNGNHSLQRATRGRHSRRFGWRRKRRKIGKRSRPSLGIDSTTRPPPPEQSECHSSAKNHCKQWYWNRPSPLQRSLYQQVSGMGNSLHANVLSIRAFTPRNNRVRQVHSVVETTQKILYRYKQRGTYQLLSFSLEQCNSSYDLYHSRDAWVRHPGLARRLTCRHTWSRRPPLDRRECHLSVH